MTILTDTIGEYTSAAGVTIDGVLLKDSTVKTDTIVEKTGATGVTVDSVLLKDGTVKVNGYTVLAADGNDSFVVNAADNVIESGLSISVIAGGGSSTNPNLIGSPTMPANSTNASGELANDTGYVALSAQVATISGGYDNVNNQLAGTIGGGGHNFIKYNEIGHSAIFAGTNHIISAGRSVIVGGAFNTIKGATKHSSFIGGGFTNIIDSNYAVIAGGYLNSIATSNYAAIGGGTENTATGLAAAIGGGNTNTASGDYSAISGGRDNSASGSYSRASGYKAVASLYGEDAYANGMFAAAGDAQERKFVLRVQTTNGTLTNLLLGDGTSTIEMPNDTTWLFEAKIAARRTDADDESAGYIISGVIDRNGAANTTALVGSITTTVVAEDSAAWDATAVASTSLGSLIIRVTGEAGKTIKWVAVVTVVQVTG